MTRIQKTLFALMLVWCAVDASGRIYACFGFDYAACQTFTQTYRGQYGQVLMCMVR
jgi:hypothetical protein